MIDHIVMWVLCNKKNWNQSLKRNQYGVKIKQLDQIIIKWIERGLLLIRRLKCRIVMKIGI